MKPETIARRAAEHKAERIARREDLYRRLAANPNYIELLAELKANDEREAAV